MEVTEDFYLVLPSNSSMLYHPDNATSCYTTYLPREIHLRGNQWTVGLVEVQIPNTIEHIADDETLYRIDGIEDEIIYQLKPGVYEHMRDFIEMINAAPGIKNHHAFKSSTARQDYYVIERVCECTSPHTLTFHDKITQIFGFEGDGFAIVTNKTEKKVEGGKPASLANAIHDKLFFYCDLLCSLHS